MTTHPVTEDIATVLPGDVRTGDGGDHPRRSSSACRSACIAAARQGSRFDHVVRVVSLVGQSVPVFVLGLMVPAGVLCEARHRAGPGQIDVMYDGMVPRVTGILLLDSRSRASGTCSAMRSRISRCRRWCSAYFSLAYISRMTRSFMLDALSQEYIVTARAKGLSGARILWRHAFGNIAVPLVTVIALAYAGLLEGSVLTETVFSWPGIGLYLTVSLLNADMNAVLGATLVIGLIYVILNLLADLSYRVLDPRTR